MYFIFLIIVLACMIIWGFARRENPFQFPFFMAGIVLVFLIPQFLILKSTSPDNLSDQSWDSICLMATLCMLMCSIGYFPRVRRHWFKMLIKTSSVVDERKLYRGAVFLGLMSHYFNYLITNLAPDEKGTQWTGIVTVYGFFRQLAYPALAIALNYALKYKKASAWFATIIIAALPLQIIVFGGRREATATFLLTLGLALYFRSRWCPPKALIIGTLTAAMLLIPAIGTYRSITGLEEWHNLGEINLKQNFINYLRNGEAHELTNAIQVIKYTQQTGDMGFGHGYLDQLVFRFIPAQFTGERFKRSLMRRPVGYFDNKLSYYLNYTLPPGATITGFADSFFEFGYLGCLFFFFLGRFFKYLWVAANFSDNIYLQVLYIQLVAPAMLSITHWTVHFLPDLIYHIFFLTILIFFAKKRMVCRAR